MDAEKYRINNTAALITPALVYYKDIIEKNTDRVIKTAGGVKRLWPHVKTHKMAALIKLQMEHGITKFKCATIAEAEMAAICGAKDILVAYPLVGPNIERFIELQNSYKSSAFWAIGDEYSQLRFLGERSTSLGQVVRLLIDVDLGMNRTGIPINAAEDLFLKCTEIKGLSPRGLHCFNGNYKIPDITLRETAVNETLQAIWELRASLERKKLDCSVLVVGSTPSFGIYAKHRDLYLSPGTAFVTDYGYYSLFKDLDFEPGAALITRVISRPAPDLFTLDLGYKGIAADPQGLRGVILGYENAEAVLHCEEHWTFRMKSSEKRPPETGELLYVIPAHICPTTALYPHALAAEHGNITARWEISARNRQITI